MVDVDLYNITELLGETSQLYMKTKANELPLLHNLLYVNKTTYKGSTNRYKTQECNMPVRQAEVIRYIKTKPDSLSMIAIDLSRHAIITRLLFEKDRNDAYTTKEDIVSFYWDSRSILKFRSVCFGDNYQDIIDRFINEYRKHNLPRGKTNVIVTFDICTLYNIVKRRTHCVNIVNNYAQNYVKMIFNENILNLSAEKLTPILNFYIYFQCKSVNIEHNVKAFFFTEEEKSSIRQDKSNFKLYIDRTYKIKKCIIEEIRLLIERNI
jgi:hypothetical protein